jgi:Ca2+-binding EF-hand superfamily protein
MNTSIRLCLAFALTAAFAAPAGAQVAADPAPDRFEAADANHDGKVDRSEYDNFVAELVLLYDTNRDGKLSRDEVATARDPSKFDRIDADHDGFLTLRELDAFSSSDFAAMDANRDGAIDRDEAKRQQ